jgi:hypothetical membrane protein
MASRSDDIIRGLRSLAGPKDAGLKNPVTRRTAGICGIAAAIVSLSSVFIAISLSPWFTWTGSWLSDLGRRAPEAVVFNSGLIAGGILALLFSAGARKAPIFRKTGGMLAISIFSLAAISLCGVGILPVSVGFSHTVFSFFFFVLSTLSLLLIGNLMRKSGMKRMGVLIIALGIASAASFPFFFVQRPFGMNAVIEIIASLSMSVFTALAGVSLLRNGFR